MDYRILESDRLEMRTKTRRLTLITGVALFISLILFSYPVLQDFKPKRHAQKTARKLAQFLSDLKTQAIVKKKPILAQFVLPDLIEVFEVTSCGPNAKRLKLWDTSLTQWNAEMIFIDAKWIKANTDWKDPVLTHFCYDPMYGSSLHADGYANGAIFLADRTIFKRSFPDPEEESAADYFAELGVIGASGDFVIR